MRRRWLEAAHHLMTRSGMMARSGPEMESVAGNLLADLCFADERDDELEAIRHLLSRRYGKYGVHGPFAAIFGRENRCTGEVATVYGEQFHRLGYLEVDRELGASEWQALLADIPGRFESKDVRRSEVESRYGPPSMVVDRRILCYASASGGWASFDSWESTARYYDNGAYRFTSDDDPLIRLVRVPADDFEDGMILTLYGKVLRWGPGWWIHHPGPDASAESLAIAAQLRSVENPLFGDSL
ncbi:hypothetical protein Aph01nite_58870 [Acrocarpospora phusangensis]|uniref:Uncharacterized protein n=1 Tax=Acrocarpospora phusangensis TaxID=1070424 RepID=A0A919QEQ8_9ACTN|nr:hypothetical protein Aph01nite_58870 [Acrocarpospora phusangensis]